MAIKNRNSESLLKQKPFSSGLEADCNFELPLLAVSTVN